MQFSWLCVQRQEDSLVGESLSGVQTPHQEADWQKLVCFHAGASAQAGPIPSWLDALFWHIGVLPTDAGTGSLAAPEGSHVLLEAVALLPH